jgi:aspartokinase-like uncharacterized kinase
MVLDKVPAPLVIKVGGSLFDLADLGPRLRRWMDTLPTRQLLIVPGGGPTADVVRDLDRRHGLGEETAHWLALRALSLNAHFLAALLPAAVVVEQVEACATVWRNGGVAVIDAHGFAREDESRPGCLPHSWSVTSDSLAARVAVRAGAHQLILLKSVTVPDAVDWTEAGLRRWVDDSLAKAVPPGLTVSTLNFRAWRP